MKPLARQVAGATAAAVTNSRRSQSAEIRLIIWTSLTISLDGKPTANAIMLKMLDQIYAVSPLQ